MASPPRASAQPVESRCAGSSGLPSGRSGSNVSTSEPGAPSGEMDAHLRVERERRRARSASAASSWTRRAGVTPPIARTSSRSTSRASGVEQRPEHADVTHLVTHSDGVRARARRIAAQPSHPPARRVLEPRERRLAPARRCSAEPRRSSATRSRRRQPAVRPVGRPCSGMSRGADASVRARGRERS